MHILYIQLSIIYGVLDLAHEDQTTWTLNLKYRKPNIQLDMLHTLCCLEIKYEGGVRQRL